MQKKLGATRYTGIDIGDDVYDGPLYGTQVDPDGFVVERIKKDMLDYAKSLPTESANAVLIAIDNSILPNEQIRKTLVRNIARFVPRGGVVMTQMSFLKRELMENGFLQLQLPEAEPIETEPDYVLQIFEKTI